jgi:hypothetical protein
MQNEDKEKTTIQTTIDPVLGVRGLFLEYSQSAVHQQSTARVRAGCDDENNPHQSGRGAHC